MDRDDGTVLASIDIPMPSPLGLSYHVRRGTFFGIDWGQDVVYEIDPATGEVLASFPVAPAGGPAWDDPTGTAWISTTGGRVYQVVGIAP